MTQKKNILLKDIDIITADKSNVFLNNVSVAIKDGRIDFIGDTDNIPAAFSPKKVIDGRHKIAMPGLVNAHTHSGMTLLRNLAEGLSLEDWLYNHVLPAEAKLSPEDVYWGTLLGIAEMIKSGTTAFADMYLHMDAVARAVVESGIRANLSKSPIKLNRGHRCNNKYQWDGCFEYYNCWNGKADGRIKVSIEVHSAYMFDECALRESYELAMHCGAGIHIHLLETLREREESIAKYGIDSVKVCEKCGIFDVPVIAAHCVHLDDDDIAILAERSVNVVHNPTSNLKLGSGIARIPRMLDEGINIALGTDGAASNNNLNMFEEINLAALIHKGVGRDPCLIGAETALHMATVNGAKAIGFEGQTGVIKEGMKADIIVLDVDKPHFCPMNDPVSAMVYCAQASDVDTVIIDGGIVMEGRELKTIDEELVKYKVMEISKRVLSE
ncbi:MAG: amidohydrolase [Acetivibrionales bacterium]